MSTQERHPIDDHFRRTLEGAEAEPPKSVWAGVIGARASRRGGGAPWSRRMLPLVLLLVGAAGVVALRSWSGQVTHAVVNGTTDGVITDELIEMGNMSMAAPPAVMNEEESSTIGTSTQTLDPDNLQELLSQPAPTATPHDVKADPVVRATPVALKRDDDQARPATQTSPAKMGAAATLNMDDKEDAAAEPLTATVPTPLHVAGAGNASLPASNAGMPEEAPVTVTVTAGTGMLGFDRYCVDRMDALWIRSPHTASPGEPRIAPPQAPYVLPNGEWWVGAQVAFFGQRQRWHGDQANLVEALDQSAAATSTIAPGLAVGRTWRSGWGLSVGMLYERTEQGFQHVDRRVDISHEIHQYMVTLNEQVFWSHSDTITHTTEHESIAMGTARRGTLLLPLEASWQGRFGRTLLSVEGGFTLELPIQRSGTMLDTDHDGWMIAREASPAELRARQPAAILGGAGIGIGRQLNEHWTLWAVPQYLHGLRDLGGANTAHALTDRWGLRFRITRHLTRTR